MENINVQIIILINMKTLDGVTEEKQTPIKDEIQYPRKELVFIQNISQKQLSYFQTLLCDADNCQDEDSFDNFRENSQISKKISLSDPQIPVGEIQIVDYKEKTFKIFQQNNLQTRHSETNPSSQLLGKIQAQKKKPRKQRGKNTEESQWQNVSSEEQIVPEDNSPFEKRKSKKTRIGNISSTKNLLINFRILFSKFIRNNEEKDFSQFLRQFETQSVNRQDYEKLFKMPEFDESLKKMFDTRYLNREFQLRRIDKKLRPVYLKKIQILKKAFNGKWFPRLN